MCSQRFQNGIIDHTSTYLFYEQSWKHQPAHSDAREVKTESWRLIGKKISTFTFCVLRLLAYIACFDQSDASSQFRGAGTGGAGGAIAPPTFSSFDLKL